MDLYRSKARIVGGLDPIVRGLERRGVAPDAVTQSPTWLVIRPIRKE